MPRPRLTIRRMMLLIVLVALLLFGAQMWRARQYRRAKAEQYLAEERDWRKTHSMLERRLAKGRSGEARFAVLSDEALARELVAIRLTSENHRTWADYSLSLARWYERRASRPWEPLGEEPPIPREIDGVGK